MNVIEVLRDHQQQLDPDGIMVGVSRQALDEVLDDFENALKILDYLGLDHNGEPQAEEIVAMRIQGLENTIKQAVEELEASEKPFYEGLSILKGALDE